MIERASRIENIWQIYHFSRECYDIATYFVNPSTKEEKEIFRNDNSLSFVQHIFFRTALIELNKLTNDSNNDVYNIHKYLRNFRCSKNINLPDERIASWENRLEELKDSINHVYLLRNKFYAHSDKDPNTFLDRINSVNNIELEALYILIGEIIQKIYELECGMALTEDFEFRNGDIGILRNYAELYRLRMNDLINNCNKI